MVDSLPFFAGSGGPDHVRTRTGPWSGPKTGPVQVLPQGRTADQSPVQVRAKSARTGPGPDFGITTCAQTIAAFDIIPYICMELRLRRICADNLDKHTPNNFPVICV